MELRSNILRIFLLTLFSTAAIQFGSAPAQAQAQPAFHIQSKWNIGGEGGWAHLLFDPSAHLLYIPRANRVAVIDPDNGQVKAEIPGFVAALSVTLDDQGKYGYINDIASGAVGYVRVFDRSTFKVIANITVGRIPEAILFEPQTRTVFSFNSRDRNASVIDAATNTVVATIPLAGKPHLAATGGHGAIFAALRGMAQIVRIDSVSRQVTATWPIAPCDGLTGLAFDAQDHQLLGACENRRLIAINPDSGEVKAIGENTIDNSGLALDPGRHLLFTASNSGALTVFHRESASQYSRQEELRTLPRAGLFALDSSTDRVYLATAKYQQQKVDGANLEESEAHLVPVPGTFVVLVAGP